VLFTFAGVLTSTLLSAGYGDSVSYWIIYCVPPVGSLFGAFGDLFTLLCIVELAVSFWHILKENGTYRAIRLPTYGLIAILAIISIAIMGLDENNGVKYAKWIESGSYYVSVDWSTVGKLYGSWIIIYWLSSLPVAVLSVFVRVKSAQQKQVCAVSSPMFSH
jgi:hypothetical protein